MKTLMFFFKTVIFVTVYLASMLLLSACHPKEEYLITKEQVLNEQKYLRGELVTIQGANGPYKDGGGMTGNYDTAGSFKAVDQTFSYPATPGIAFYEHTYINAQGKTLVVVRKMSKTDVPKTPADKP
jgi:hypothetical protein